MLPPSRPSMIRVLKNMPGELLYYRYTLAPSSSYVKALLHSSLVLSSSSASSLFRDAFVVHPIHFDTALDLGINMRRTDGIESFG